MKVMWPKNASHAMMDDNIRKDHLEKKIVSFFFIKLFASCAALYFFILALICELKNVKSVKD